ncbi:hypothetical protein LAZ67_16001995 [Cordylochernes scorpioides]|uniref:RNA-directed DNA polymerase n=1 Tax=Cordylochernes scorpioides TaxID=51811 RepID=A0ABY6LEB8_9ARAC|nr:hypothetical protein LAZ67_16001995 [Cordylochernes scorpioides]
MYQLDAPLSPLTYHFAVLPERCTYWECQADLCKAHTIFPPSANNTQYAHFSDNTSTTQGLTQPPHHVQSKNFFRANCSYYRVKVPEQPPNANLSHPTKVQTDHLHHTPKHPHSTHHYMYHTHHPTSPEHLPGIPIDNQPQPPYPPQFPALLRQYQHVFSRNKFAVPCLKVPPVRIATNSDKVVTIRPYRVPICDQREIRSQIRQMLDNDIIEPSYSPFSSPVTLVTKRDKTKRFCIDYRKVNEVISSDVHPLPRIEDILDRLARAKYFSTADVSSAYWQVPIHPDSRPLLAFATIDGLYQPTRLPFGLKTSPQIYERAINQVLQGHGLDCVAHYFDDFVIYSETLEEHQEHLRRFFAFCDAENLQLNLTKCEFFRQTIEFLGYTITAGTTTPLIRNTDVIHAIPPPNNRKTLQSFLGAVNVYNKFIPDYARLRTPLNNLLKKDVTWDWDDKCQKAFTSLKESLTQHPVLHLYKDELPCQVYCDASTLGIAGVLKQVHSAGKAYPVQYFSRALRVHERNYTISELECLAIVESVEKFRVYLMGRKFTIFSDHHALQWLKTIKNPSGRLFRWSLRLSCYEYEVRYIKGSLQHEADLLSRNPFCGFLDATIIKNHQLTPSGESKLTIDRNGLQTLKRRGVTKIVVPDALVPDLLTKVHSRYNHPGISQMTRLISTQYYWKGMSEDISKTTKACAICQSTKHPRGPTFGELGQLPVGTQPFDLVALDTIAGLAKYGNAKTYLHVVVDHFSRYTWTFPSKSTSLTTYQQVIKRVLQDGSPKRLLTDRAPAFTSPKFRKFLINRNIHPLLTTSNNPQANGLCERLNATLTGKLRLLHLENPKAAWTKLAKRVTVVYNNTPHSVTGFPPGYLMFGVLPPELTEHVNPYPVLTTARRIAHERTQAKHLKDKHAYDQQHKTPHFEPGDLVLVKVYHHPNTGKLAPYFTGPYEILEIISPNVVRINRPNQPLNRNTDTVHVNKLQYYNENIRYIAPPTLIPHPAKPQSRTLPPLFEHLTPDLFTVERFAPTIGNCTTTTPVDPQCNIIAQRDIPQPAISRPTHITKVKTPIPTVRADPKPIPLQTRFFRNVETFPLFHLLYLINLFILPTVLLPMATLLYVSVYTLQPNRLFQLQEALFEITIAVVELIHRTIGIILPELWTILVHSHALVALIGTARKWFENNEETSTSWDDFQRALGEAFGQQEDVIKEAESLLKNRAQKVKESSEAYIQDVLYLCQVLNPRMDDETKLGHLMKGVAEDIYQILIAKDVENERRQAILQAASCGRKDVKLSCKQRLVDGENALEYPSSSNLRAEKTLRQSTSRDNWTSHKTSQAKPSLRRCCHEERRQAILQAASCGRKDVKLSCKQRLVDGENALEYPSSSNLRAEKTLRQPTSRDNWTSHKTSQAKPSLRRCCHEKVPESSRANILEILEVKSSCWPDRGVTLKLARPCWQPDSIERITLWKVDIGTSVSVYSGSRAAFKSVGYGRTWTVCVSTTLRNSDNHSAQDSYHSNKALALATSLYELAHPLCTILIRQRTRTVLR